MSGPFVSFVVFLLLATLYKAGGGSVPAMLLELAAVAFLLALAWRRGPGGALAGLAREAKIAIGVFLAYPLLQLVPLPQALWTALPGHADYAIVLKRFAAVGEAWALHAISVVPAATEAGWLALLPPLACVLVVRWFPPSQVIRLLLAMGIFTGLEALLGLLQARAGRDSIFWLSDVAPGTATGTFLSRDHFAAMLAMMLPVLVGLLVYSLRFGRRRMTPPAFAFDPDALICRALMALSIALILFCLPFTGSRIGILSALAGLVFCCVLAARVRGRLGYANVMVSSVVVVAIAVTAFIGTAPLPKGFMPDALAMSTGGRAALTMATVQAAMDFLPLGSGLSTFADVFPRYQNEVFGGYIDNAHNDYLQLLLELGVAAPVIVFSLLAGYVLRMGEHLRQEGRRSFTIVQVAAGIGLLPVIVQSLFDSALHMPANAMWCATLAGVLLHPGVVAGVDGDAARRAPHVREMPSTRD